MADNANHSIKGDRALSAGDDDRLGFREVAKRIAIFLIDRSTEDGLVIGLEGLWGSGKSSLLFLISDELEKLPSDRKPTIISFRPWLIGNRDALIASLFGELSVQLDNASSEAGNTSRINRAKAKRASEALRRFGAGLSKTGSMVKFVGKASGLGLVEMAGEGIKSIGEVTENEVASPTLPELKSKLAESLSDLGHRFVVTIDDVDRLEPAEVIEILRLVRSVVDLPNMIYFLCYDSGIIAHSIEKAAGVASGRSYLEKIVQLTVMVPTPEPLQLRQWFSDELQQIASTKGDDERSRLGVVIDYEGGRQLRTPRSVVRALDAIRFFWPPLSHEKADLADLVWLHLIKEGNTRLYRWIEEYCSTMAVIALGVARVSEAERASKTSDMIATVDAEYFSDRMYQHFFSEQIPGVEFGFSESEIEPKIFCQVSDRDCNQAIRDKRLASPDHYRLYFALEKPSHVLSYEELSSIWAAAEAGPELLGTALLGLHAKIASGKLSKADLLFERVKGGAYEVLSPIQCENLLLAVSNVMDQAYRVRSFDLFWISTLWDRAKQLIPSILSRLDPIKRESVISTMFEQGSAIAWLTSLLRYETFAHGRQGDQRRPEPEWLFTNEELDLISTTMLGRFKTMSIREIFGSLNPMSLLFAWRQAGDEAGPRHLIDAGIVSDQGLVETLEGLLTTIESSDRGKFKVLKMENLVHFMNADDARQRIRALKDHPELGQRARQLTTEFDDGDHF